MKRAGRRSKNKRDETLIRIKFKQAIEEIDAARQTAEAARAKLGGILAARQSALAAGADSLSENSWKKTEERFRDVVRESSAATRT